MRKKNAMTLFVAIIIGLFFFALAWPLKPSSPLPQKQSEETLDIEVRKGSCLSKIAYDLGADWKEIAELNRINPNRIFPGQKIKVRPFSKTNIVKVSWYGPGFHGKTMSNKKIFDMYDPTIVAHKWLPFGTKVQLTRIDNKKSIVVTVQDRSPYVQGRIFDLSHGAAELLDMINEGVITCEVRILD